MKMTMAAAKVFRVDVARITYIKAGEYFFTGRRVKNDSGGFFLVKKMFSLFFQLTLVRV